MIYSNSQKKFDVIIGLETESLMLVIVESGLINCAMSQAEVRELRKSVLPCHLLSAYNW